jgi:predicted thioredoxin/glutaredoxin
MARLAWHLALASPAVRLDLVDASLFVELAVAAGIRSVPALQVDGSVVFTAGDTEPAIVALLLERYRVS